MAIVLTHQREGEGRAALEEADGQGDELAEGIPATTTALLFEQVGEAPEVLEAADAQFLALDAGGKKLGLVAEPRGPALDARDAGVLIDGVIPEGFDELLGFAQDRIAPQAGGFGEQVVLDDEIAEQAAALGRIDEIWLAGHAQEVGKAVDDAAAQAVKGVDVEAIGEFRGPQAWQGVRAARRRL